MSELQTTLAWPSGARLRRDTRTVLSLLEKLGGGLLEVSLPDGGRFVFGDGEPVAVMQVRDEQVFSRVLARGDIGLAEAWLDGEWSSPDVTALLTLLARNRAVLRQALYGAWHRLLLSRVRHAFNRNSRAGSRRNIMAHYDLGNDFYALWLDPSMTYSAAVFASPDESLADAQLRKYRRILGELGVQPGQTILEVGCGWGGFAEVAATEFGCKVLGITLSPSQLEFARARAERGRFADRVDFELCDYRDVRGQYDHVVSIEMIEAVGERFWPTYFAQLSGLLKPGGRCVVQAITIADALFARYRRGTDFIQRHVFPGGMLPSPGAVAQQAGRAGLEVVGDFAFGRDYARTLAHWHRSFDAQAAAVRAQGFPERFLRMWRFYLAYCEAGFDTGDIDVHHYVFAHAGAASRAG